MLVSKETAIIVNNWFMMFFLSVVLIGTVYPIFLEVISGSKISIGPPFYQKLMIPFLVPFLLFMALGPKLKWIKDNLSKINLNQIIPLILSIVISYLIVKLFGISYLFIVPLFAVGFATNILNRNPKDVVNACISTLKGKKMPSLPPWLNEFSGTFTRDTVNPKTWKISGVYEVLNTTTVKVTEIPPGFTYERYEEHLNNLTEKRIISGYEDNSSGKVEYVLKFQRAVLKDYISRNKLEALLKINTQETENLTTIDENGELKIFNKVEEIVKHFVEVRLTWYDKRKAYLLSKIERELLIISNKARFIKDIIDGKLKVNNVPKKTIVLYLETANYDEVDGSYNYLLNMPIYSLTKERFEELLIQESEKEKEKAEIEGTNPKDMYLSDLEALKKALK